MEKITLKIFWFCLLSCAGYFIIGIWLGETAPEVLFKAGGTLFIIGLSNFLLWAPTIAYRFLGKF